MVRKVLKVIKVILEPKDLKVILHKVLRGHKVTPLKVHRVQQGHLLKVIEVTQEGKDHKVMLETVIQVHRDL